MSRVLPVLPLLLLLACAGDPSGGDPKKAVYAPQLGVDLNAMREVPQAGSNLWVQDLVVGTGTQAFLGDILKVHYTGWLTDGTEFDSGDFSFLLGQGSVIAGWDLGLPQMRVGGKRKLVIPSNLAYGSDGNGAIPPNAVLVFDVELLEVRSQ